MLQLIRAGLILTLKREDAGSLEFPTSCSLAVPARFAAVQRARANFRS